MRRRALASAFALAGCALGAQGVDAILAKHVQAIGGLDKLRAIHAVKLKGTLEVAPGVALPLVMEMARPNRSRLEAGSGDRVFLRLFDGAKGWESSPATGGALRPFTAAEVQDAQRASFDGDLIDPSARGARVESMGRQMINGHDTYRLKVTEKDGSVSTHWVDVDHFLELQREREVASPEGRKTETEAFSDFRLVEGVAMPFRVRAGQKYSQQVQTIQIAEVLLNPAVSDADFKPPATR